MQAGHLQAIQPHGIVFLQQHGVLWPFLRSLAMRYFRVRWELSGRLLCSFLVIRMTLGLWAALLSQPRALGKFLLLARYILAIVKKQQKVQFRELLGLGKN